MAVWLVLILVSLVVASVIIRQCPRLNLVGRVGITLCAWYVGYVLLCLIHDTYTGAILARYTGVDEYLR